MATQEIKSTDWEQFCKRFKELHQGQMITMDQINTMGACEPIAEDIPLEDIRFEQMNGCSDQILVIVQEFGKEEIQHLIVEPIHVKVREEVGGGKALQIDAETGSTVIRFSSGKMSQLMEGLE